MCIRDRVSVESMGWLDFIEVNAKRYLIKENKALDFRLLKSGKTGNIKYNPVSYTHLRAHETVLDLVCRLLLEKKK